MAATSHLNGRQQREPFPKKAQTKAPAGLPGDLLVMAALLGISRAFFGPRKQGPVAQTLSGLQDAFTSSGRGREAEKPSEIPAKGWKDIAWRVYDGIQDDRVLLVAAGVTFYAPVSYTHLTLPTNREV